MQVLNPEKSITKVLELAIAGEKDGLTLKELIKIATPLYRQKAEQEEPPAMPPTAEKISNRVHSLLNSPAMQGKINLRASRYKHNYNAGSRTNGSSELFSEASSMPKEFVLTEGNGHCPTQTKEKLNVIESENNFLSARNGGKQAGVFLGVIGNGHGLKNHCKQASELGYGLQNTYFFEMSKDYFNHIAYHYIMTFLKGHGGVEVENDFIYLNSAKLKAVTVLHHWRDGIVGFISNRKHIPNLIWGELPTNGELIKNYNINGARVTHIDFDITVGVEGPNEIIAAAQEMYGTYKHLKSAVFVYSWQRNRKTLNRVQKVRTSFQQKWEEDMTSRILVGYSLETDIKRPQQAILDLAVRKALGWKTQAQAGAEDITNALQADNIGTMAQIYSGVGGKLMLSVSTAKNKPSEPNMSRTLLGERNIEHVRTVCKYIKRYGQIGREKFHTVLEKLLQEAEEQQNSIRQQFERANHFIF